MFSNTTTLFNLRKFLASSSSLALTNYYNSAPSSDNIGNFEHQPDNKNKEMSLLQYTKVARLIPIQQHQTVMRDVYITVGQRNHLWTV